MKRKFLFSTLFPVVLFSVLACAGANAATIVSNGKANAVILLDKEATRSAQLGAFELQHHVKLITGAELPIVREVPSDGRLIIKIGGENSGIKEEASLIKFSKGKILLTGGDTADYAKVDYQKPNTYPPVRYHWKGSLFAVYDFLEDYCDVHFYGMDPLDTTYKKRKTLEVPECDRNFSSKMDGFRDFYDDFYPSGHLVKKSGRDHALWKLRWRSSVTYGKVNHNSYSIYFAHWDKAKDPYLDKAFKSRQPEMFASGYEGKSASVGYFLEKRYPGDVNIPPQLCYSNPKTIEYYAKEAITYYHGGNTPGGWENIDGKIPRDKTLLPKFPGKPFFYPYEGNDTGEFCHCDLCRKYAKAGDFSGAKFRFLNALAEKAAELDPGKPGFATLAYNDGTLPFPDGLTINDRVSVELCLVCYAWWHPGVYRKNMENYRKWVNALKGKSPLTLWLYVYGPQHDSKMFYGDYKAFPQFYPWQMGKMMKQFNADGIKGVFAECKMPVNYLEAYIVSKLAYDSSRNPDEVIRKFFTDYYGKAGPYMEQFYRIVEQAIWNPSFVPKEWTKNLNELKGPGDRLISAWWPINLWSREQNWKLAEPGRMKQLSEIIAKAESLVESTEEKERLKRFIDGVWTPILEGLREHEIYLKQKEIPPRTITLDPLEDGANGDPRKIDWSRAPVTEKWLDTKGNDNGSSARIQTAVDSKYFYLKFHEERKPELSKGIWSENVEFFFCSDGNFPLYHFAQGPKTGSKPTGLIHRNVNGDLRVNSYDFQAETFSIPTEKDWTLYVSIPREKLPIRNNSMDLDFFRMHHDGKQWDISCWQPTYTVTGSKGMDSFGKLFILPYTVEDKEFKLIWEGSGTGRVSDPEAKDGSAAFQVGKISWYVSYPIPKAFIRDKVDIIMRVRIKAEKADRLNMGVHDWKAKKRVVERTVPVKEINGTKYGEFKIGSAVLTHDMSVYLGTILFEGKWQRNSEDITYLDSIRFEKPKEE